MTNLLHQMDNNNENNNNSSKPPPYQHRSLKGINWVIFPQNQYIQIWDNAFLCVLVYYCFAIPYTAGVSGGYWMATVPWWFILNMILNAFYVVDTFMLFFRAYYDKDGVIVYELRKIAKHYVTSGQFFIHLLASAPMQLILYMLNKKYDVYEGSVENRDLNFLILTALLRLLKLPRAWVLIKTSYAFQSYWERQSVPKTMLISFVAQLIVTTHWIACTWSFIAFIQVRTFGQALGEEPNWISYWMDSNYVDGGVNPIGYDNDIDRYALSLFWSIQSVTSIGYGNIVPVTRLEYYFANILMLVQGLYWAFTIGNIVSVVRHMNSNDQQYKRSLDRANKMIQSFSPINKEEAGALGHPDRIAKRIRKFVASQYDYKDIIERNGDSNTPRLEELYPALPGLSDELRRLASLQLMGKYLEMIPYLSREYLSLEEQSELAFKCHFVEFSRADLYFKHPQFGRGIIIPKKGMAMSIGTVGNHGIIGRGDLQTYGIDDPFGVEDVLVEDTFLDDELPLYRFSSYALVIFIPQSVIYEVLNNNVRAWKNCGRWKYLQTCLLKLARRKKDGLSSFARAPICPLGNDDLYDAVK